jgi:hypothetical protein
MSTLVDEMTLTYWLASVAEPVLQLTCTVKPVTKFEPLMVNGTRCGVGTPTTDDGVIEPIDGAGLAASW